MVAVPVPPGAAQRDLAQLAGVDVFALGLQVVLPGALLHAYLADALVDARGFDDGGAFLDGAGQRLFDVEILAGVERVDGDGGVPMIRNAHERGIDIFLLDEFAVVGVSAGAGGVFLGQADVRFVDVAEAHDIDDIRLDEVAHVVTAAVAAADQAEADAVVGAEHAAV